MRPDINGDNVRGLSNCTKAQIKFRVSTLPPNCIETHTKENYSNYFYPGKNMTPERFCQTMYPQYKDVETSYGPNASVENCKIMCCWNQVLGVAQEREVISTEDSESYDYSIYGGEPKQCLQHSMTEAMPCGDNKTCFQGVCDEHNWTEIYNTYRTYRTFNAL
uniref:Reprolysin n=1 Tax=Rhipicephalus zambeziensis TaxID=60191 RepID=A0A224YJW5_9ACAR